MLAVFEPQRVLPGRPLKERDADDEEDLVVDGKVVSIGALSVDFDAVFSREAPIEHKFEAVRSTVEDFVRLKESRSIIVVGNPESESQYFGPNGLFFLMIQRSLELLREQDLPYSLAVNFVCSVRDNDTDISGPLRWQDRGQIQMRANPEGLMFEGARWIFIRDVAALADELSLAENNFLIDATSRGESQTAMTRCYTVSMQQGSGNRAELSLATVRGTKGISSVANSSGIIALGHCLTARAKDSVHIPFRDSKFTRRHSGTVSGLVPTQWIFSLGCDSLRLSAAQTLMLAKAVAAPFQIRRRIEARNLTAFDSMISPGADEPPGGEDSAVHRMMAEVTQYQCVGWDRERILWIGFLKDAGSPLANFTFGEISQVLLQSCASCRRALDAPALNVRKRNVLCETRDGWRVAESDFDSEITLKPAADQI